MTQNSCATAEAAFVLRGDGDRGPSMGAPSENDTRRATDSCRGTRGEDDDDAVARALRGTAASRKSREHKVLEFSRARASNVLH